MSARATPRWPFAARNSCQAGAENEKRSVEPTTVGLLCHATDKQEPTDWFPFCGIAPPSSLQTKGQPRRPWLPNLGSRHRGSNHRDRRFLLEQPVEPARVCRRQRHSDGNRLAVGHVKARRHNCPRSLRQSLRLQQLEPRFRRGQRPGEDDPGCFSRDAQARAATTADDGRVRSGRSARAEDQTAELGAVVGWRNSTSLCLFILFRAFRCGLHHLLSPPMPPAHDFQ